jgi:hypothetical protein
MLIGKVTYEGVVRDHNIIYFFRKMLTSVFLDTGSKNKYNKNILKSMYKMQNDH